MDLEKLDGYGTDELKSALEDILEALLTKQFKRGQSVPIQSTNQKIVYTEIRGQKYVLLSDVLDILQGNPK